MNILRFCTKCITDQGAAWNSVKLVTRSLYGRAYWTLKPSSPLRCELKSGGSLLLEPGHSFTSCFWPAVENYEPDVREALLHFLKPGATFVDCGANIGYFSVLAGAVVGRTGKIVSIEANPVTHRLLQRNLTLNHLGQAVHCALTSSPGEVELFMPRFGGDVFSSIRKGGLVAGPDVETFRVSGRTLDEVVSSLNLPNVDVLKIDIEGAELDVLRSAPQIMRSLRPVILCEYGTNTWPVFGATKDDLLGLLEEYGYRAGMFDLRENRVREVDERVWSSPYANLILEPSERCERPPQSESNISPA